MTLISHPFAPTTRSKLARWEFRCMTCGEKTKPDEWHPVAVTEEDVVESTGLCEECLGRVG